LFKYGYIQMYPYLSYKLIFSAFDVICVVLRCKKPCQLAQFAKPFCNNFAKFATWVVYFYRLSVISALKLNIESHRLLLSLFIIVNCIALVPIKALDRVMEL